MQTTGSRYLHSCPRRCCASTARRPVAVLDHEDGGLDRDCAVRGDLLRGVLEFDLPIAEFWRADQALQVCPRVGVSGYPRSVGWRPVRGGLKVMSLQTELVGGRRVREDITLGGDA